MARRRVNTTKYEIIRQATKLFLEQGYSETSPKQICDALDISTGNLTYYFPTKEHLLAVLVEMLCSFQSRLLHNHIRDEGATSVMAVCLELATMVAMNEHSQIAKDLLHCAYSSPMCLDIIRKNDTQRSKQIYRQYCPDWTEQQFVEAEILVSGIEYATLTTTEQTLSMDTRVAGALNNIMTIYGVPEQIRQMKIAKVLAMDYRTQGIQVLEQFRAFVEQTNAQTFATLLGDAAV